MCVWLGVRVLSVLSRPVASSPRSDCQRSTVGARGFEPSQRLPTQSAGRRRQKKGLARDLDVGVVVVGVVVVVVVLKFSRCKPKSCQTRPRAPVRRNTAESAVFRPMGRNTAESAVFRPRAPSGRLRLTAEGLKSNPEYNNTTTQTSKGIHVNI